MGTRPAGPPAGSGFGPGLGGLRLRRGSICLWRPQTARLERCATRRLRGGACEHGRLERHRHCGPGQQPLDRPLSYAHGTGRAGMGVSVSLIVVCRVCTFSRSRSVAHAPRSTSLLAPWSQVCEARPQALDQAVRDRLCALIKAVAAQGLSHDRGCSGWPALVVDGGSHVEPWKAAPQPALPVVAVAMVWKWDDTPVRWRRGQGQISGSPVHARS